MILEFQSLGDTTHILKFHGLNIGNHCWIYPLSQNTSQAPLLKIPFLKGYIPNSIPNTQIKTKQVKLHCGLSLLSIGLTLHSSPGHQCSLPCITLDRSYWHLVSLLTISSSSLKWCFILQPSLGLSEDSLDVIPLSLHFRNLLYSKSQFISHLLFLEGIVDRLVLLHSGLFFANSFHIANSYIPHKIFNAILTKYASVSYCGLSHWIHTTWLFHLWIMKKISN